MKRPLLALAFLLLLLDPRAGASDSELEGAGAILEGLPRCLGARMAEAGEPYSHAGLLPELGAEPLDAKIGGRWSSGASVGKDRSYLAGFIWFEKGSEVHINLRGYPGRTAIPKCRNDEQAGGKRVKTYIPCFADAKKPRTVAGYKVTLYTVNRDADQWHLLYAWRRNGSLYTVSEHVAPPFGYQRVLQNLNRMMQNLVLIQPR